MRNISWGKIILVCLIALTGYIIYHLFNTQFAKTTIDYFAFITGIFLVMEGLYKISKSKASLFPDQFLRGLRIIIGIWIFTIHLFQFMRYRVFSTQIAEITIAYKDYFPFFAGMFLVVEGFYKISKSKAHLFPDQFPRVFRIIIGTCLFTIHLLQFMHSSATCL